MDEKKTPQPEQAAPETGKPLSEKRKSALLRYMAVLFCAAFILVLISLILQTHSSEAKISELNAASTSALSNAEALQNENRALQDDKIALEKENQELQDKLGVAYLFIAHDLLVVHHISDRIAVMYLGKMMEIADADELNGNPMHPYTLSLLSAVPIPDPETARHSKRIVLEGDVPSPLKMPTGCPFRTRCKYATEQCAKEMPPLSDRGSGHFVACWNK